MHPNFTNLILAQTNKTYKQELSHPIYPIVAQAADELGLEAYVVGGVVRDIIMRRHNTDIDIVTVGSGIELAKKTAALIDPELHVNVYRNFGTAQFNYEGSVIEFVGARRESYSHDSRKPVVEDGTLEDDQMRRDFTINAMAIALNGVRRHRRHQEQNHPHPVRSRQDLLRRPAAHDARRALRHTAQLRHLS